VKDYSDTVHCPECGRFVRSIRATIDLLGLTGVYAKCKVHGSIEPIRVVDGEQVGWSWDDFNGGDDGE